MKFARTVAFAGIMVVFSQNCAEASQQVLHSEITASANESSSATKILANQLLISQKLERATQLTEPILTNFLQLLKNLNKVTKELGDSAPEKTWNNFVTSTRYVNFRMITFEKGYFEPKHIPKELSLLRARKDCMWSCANNQSCLAFNLYDTENYFVCEMLPDNLCVNRTKIAFAEWPGSTVWEKMSSAVEQSCVDAMFPVGRSIPCEALRPGCFGEWPQCSNCLQTCKDTLYSYDIREFTLWPEGDGPFMLPVFAHCWKSALYLLRREVNLTEARLTHNYIMPNFVTSTRYVNFRMITFEKGYFAPKYIPKELSLLRARKDCMWSCAKNESCLAFNLYDTENYFVCEMLPDNLCVNRTKIAFAEWPGSTVWEKMSSAVQQSCVDAKFPVGRRIPCEALRPGCFGEWPQCSKCFRTCKDPYKLYRYVNPDLTLWPEGDGPFVLPVFAHCWGSDLYLLRREVNLTEARLKHNYIMPFEDMHRFWRLKTYPYIIFRFKTANSNSFINYENWYIDASGSLTNLTYKSSDPPKLDIFDLNGQAMKPTPFIHVKEDRFGCGSFWLLDPNNATYCPGGRVSMLGEMRVEGRKVVSTGMSIPEALARNEIVHYAYIILWV